jgi:DNA-binding GntR family transcriptional regulator
MVSSDRLPEPLERATQTFSDRTVEVLRETVISGRLRAGERLNEVELANALGISRGPLREAIQRLHSEGLLTSIPNRGAFVRVITPKQLSELYEVRIALEGHALRLAARSVSAEQIDELNQLLDGADSLVSQGRADGQDGDFHRRFIALAENDALARAITDVRRQINLARSRSGRNPDRARLALAEHREITEQLARRRADGAARALEKHLRSSLASALTFLGQDQAEGQSPAGSRRY